MALLLYAIDPDEPIRSIFAGLSLVIALALWPAGTDVPIARLALALVCGQATAYYLIMRAVGPTFRRATPPPYSWYCFPWLPVSSPCGMHTCIYTRRKSQCFSDK